MMVAKLSENTPTPPQVLHSPSSPLSYNTQKNLKKHKKTKKSEKTQKNQKLFFYIIFPLNRYSYLLLLQQPQPTMSVQNSLTPPTIRETRMFCFGVLSGTTLAGYFPFPSFLFLLLIYTIYGFD
jgi:hypothetical protein